MNLRSSIACRLISAVLHAAPQCARFCAGLFLAAPSANAQISHPTDGFEDYGPPAPINGVGGWTSSSTAMEGGRLAPGWYVANWPWISGGVGGGNATGNFLLRAHPFSQYGTDWATLHLTSAAPIETLAVSFHYLLQANERAEIAISGDNARWVDVTPAFELVPRYSNDVTWPAAADLRSYLTQAAITRDVYVRFMAWNPSGSGSWHWFAIDNLQVIATADLCEQALNDALAALAAANAQVSSVTAQLTQAEQQLAAANGSLGTIDAALAAVETEFRQEFSNSTFVIPGNSTAERVQALADAVILLNRGRTQGIYDALR